MTGPLNPCVNGKRCEGREGHVDATGNQNKVGGDGEESGDDHCVCQVNKVVCREELAASCLDDECEGNDNQENPEFVGSQDLCFKRRHVHHAPWVATSRDISSPSSASDVWAGSMDSRIRPARMMRTFEQFVRTSAMSSEMMTMAMPSRARR